MENTEQSLEKTDDNYKVPNLEKGIAVIEYLSSYRFHISRRRYHKRVL